ncbi:TPA: hypothetical protein I7750_19540 [Vibrio vulnificus]|nr:hypothetical protein [Vibrio vulnificus]
MFGLILNIYNDNLSYINKDKDNIYFLLKLNFIIFPIIFISSFILASYSQYFPDYNNYDNYIVGGTSFLRFYREPLSALIMQTFHYFGLSAYEYYLSSILVLFYSISRLVIKSKCRFPILTVVLIFFNPVTLILIQTPRHVYSMALALLAFSSKGSKLYFLLLLSLLLHNVMGALAVFFLVTSKVNNKINYILASAGVLFFVAVLSGFINLGYDFYDTSEIQRGVGRVLLFVILLLYTSIVVCKNRSALEYFLIFSAMSVLLYFITPFSHRISSFLYIMIITYLLSHQKNNFNILFSILILLCHVGLSIYIIWCGELGYS